LEKLSASLSAADLHAVVMGEQFKGIVHPCKIYNILSIGVPLLYIGPAESHIMDVIAGVDEKGYARSAGHGDIDRVAKHILDAASEKPKVSTRAVAFASRFSQERLLAEMVKEIGLSIKATGSVPDRAAFEA
jgi:hypothetical protein